MKAALSTSGGASSSSFPSLTALMFLRGGQQGEADTVASDESSTLDAGDGTSYGTAQQGDEESTDSSVDVEMTSSQPAADVESAEVDNTSVTKPSKNAVPSPLLAVIAPVSGLVQKAATIYSQQLTARPVLTKSLTAGIIFALSDWCAQLIEREDEGESKTPIVFSRVLSTFLVGLLFFGPAANAWYSMIFKILPSTSLLSTLQKAALGQIFFGPTFTAVFFGAGMIQSGSFSLGAWLSKIKTDLPGVWASGLGYWPLVDFISYKVVPVQWIPLFVNFCSFVWTIYLSLVANRGKGGVEDFVEE